MTNLRDRIAAVLDESLHRQKGIDRPDRFKDWIDNRELADAVLEMLPTREGKWGWMDGTVSTNPQTGNPVKLEIEPGEVIPLSVEDARNVALALLAAVAECEADK